MEPQQGRAMTGSCLGGTLGGALGVLAGAAVGYASLRHHYPGNPFEQLDACVAFFGSLAGAAIGGVVGAIVGSVCGAGTATRGSGSASVPLPSEGAAESRASGASV